MGSGGRTEYGDFEEKLEVMKGSAIDSLVKQISWPYHLPNWDLWPLTESENRQIDYNKSK